MCSHFNTQLILSCPGRPVVFSEVIIFGMSQRTAGVSQNGGEHMVKIKQGTHRSKMTWRVQISQNGADHMVRTKKGTHGFEWTWCAEFFLEWSWPNMLRT